MDAAVDYLREKGLASQAKKSGRVAAEGTVCALVENGVGAMVELNSETDFVANGDGFKALAAEIAAIVAESNPADLDALLKCEKDGSTVEEKVQELFLAIRENIKVRRFVRYEGNVVSYVHGGGKIGVMVKFDTDADANDAEVIASINKGVGLEKINTFITDILKVVNDASSKQEAYTSLKAMYGKDAVGQLST
jgi:elongation factor Ts